MSTYPLLVLLIGKSEAELTDEDYAAIWARLSGVEIRYERYNPRNDSELAKYCQDLKPDALVMWTKEGRKIILNPHCIGNVPSIDME